MRGKEVPASSSLIATRITPACAGKRRRRRGVVVDHRDHPRMCGEKVPRAALNALVRGSPPRMRGKDAVAVAGCIEFGITPAYAGKRLEPAQAGGKDEDHPRVCGEKLICGGCDRDELGSPPRMRGKGWQGEHQPERNGITPACAGKRLKRSRSTVSPVAIVPLFPSVCNKPVVSDSSPAGRDAPLFLPAENAVPASPAYNLRSL